MKCCSFPSDADLNFKKNTNTASFATAQREIQIYQFNCLLLSKASNQSWFCLRRLHLGCASIPQSSDAKKKKYLGVFASDLALGLTISHSSILLCWSSLQDKQSSTEAAEMWAREVMTKITWISKLKPYLSHSKTDDSQCLEGNSRNKKKLQLSNEEIKLGIAGQSDANAPESHATSPSSFLRTCQNSQGPVALQVIILQLLFFLLIEKCALLWFYEIEIFHYQCRSTAALHWSMNVS